jgi:hypothetical protein
MRYVLCPKCGDPVTGPLRQENTCVHCKETFPLSMSEVQMGLILYNEKTKRWKVGRYVKRGC